GPAQKMPATASAMDFFQLFVPDNAIQNMVTQTNMYAKKFQERFGSDEGWCNVTLSEMKAFLGYVTSTSIHRCESVLSIWSSGFYSNKSIALIMTQSRFEKILKYFHIVAFRSSQTSNGLYKIQPFLDSLQQSLECSFRPSQTQVLHEPLIDEDPVFITTCTERELRKRKKRKFSLWVRQCTATGFICQVYVHLKEGAGPDSLDTLKNKPQLHSLVAKQLCQNLSGKNSIIFTGPSITSLNLFEEFEKKDIYCCGLLSSRKSDCTGLPQSMLTNHDAPQRRGQYKTKMKGNMSLICWYNKGHFRFLTNAYSPSKQDIYCCGLLSSRKSDCTGLPQSMLTNHDAPQRRGQYKTKMKGNMSLICWYNKGHFRFLTNAYSPSKQGYNKLTSMFRRRGQYKTKMKGNMSLICWYNKGHFRFLTNAYSPSKQEINVTLLGVIIKRKSGEVPCPLAVEAFAAHLSYICKYDDKYSKYFIFHKPNKTWQQVFWLTISIVINNAYIQYKMSDAYHMKRYSRAQFGERLVRELLGLEDCSPTQ
ncbi:UNVERIFIED_CONTAM: hypothetical protein FKN15_064327, partial [Acipenser sinensis]